MNEKRCELTGNLCGTDTWAADVFPDCRCGQIESLRRQIYKLDNENVRFHKLYSSMNKVIEGLQAKLEESRKQLQELERALKNIAGHPYANTRFSRKECNEIAREALFKMRVEKVKP